MQAEAGVAPRGTSDQEAIHEEFLCFHCNFIGQSGEACKQAIEDGWVTQCSHVFCFQHAKEWFADHDDCPICRGDQRVKMVRMNFSRAQAQRRSRMSLVGLTPQDIIRASENALNFWVDQKVFEFHNIQRRNVSLVEHHKKVEDSVRQRLKVAEDSCNGLEAETRDLQKKIEETDAGNAKAEQEVQRLKRQIAEAEEQYYSLVQRRHASHRMEFFQRPLMSEAAPGSARRAPQSMGLRGEAPRDERDRTTSAFGGGAFASHQNVRSHQPRSDGVVAGGYGDARGDTYVAAGYGGAEARGYNVGRGGVAAGARRLPTFTPGMIGAGRVNKRRLA